MQNQKGNISVIVTFIIVACIIGFVVYGLLNKTSDTSKTDESNKITTTPDTSSKTEVKEENKTSTKNMDQTKRLLPNFKPVAKVSSLEKIDTVVGTGDEVKPGATVSVHYTGAIASTGEVFQSSKDFGTNPITFPLSGVIKGWTDGIPGMKIGGTRRLIIPAAQAYGANPPQGSGIPANADLVFDVELIAIK
jgi:FKBP-type peptidyl-prolyl cis-trans isomerase